jgi:hypothetical protein
LKKHLTSRGQPLGLLEALKGKHKSLGFIENLLPGKDLKTNKAYFTATWSLKGYPNIVGESQDYNKQKARHMAAQRFLKALFLNPESKFKGSHPTWNVVVDQILSKKTPLTEVLELPSE